MSAQDSNHMYVCVCVCLCVCVFEHPCVFLYITTVNMFLAQLNLSKQHTPSWAVKRADRDTREGEKNSQMRERPFVFREFLSKTPLERARQDRVRVSEREGIKSQRAVNKTRVSPAIESRPAPWRLSKHARAKSV